MKKFYKLAIASAIFGFGLGTLNTAEAATFTQTASDQGWWAAEDGLNGPNSNDNTNYVTGNIRGTDLRNFFKFDLGDLVGVSSATLQIQRFKGSGNPTETLGFFDVSTPADVLSQKNNSPNNTIYNDLGSGKNYGSFNVTTSGDPNEILSFALNSNAIADINARSGNFFSIGGALLGDLSEEYLFSESGDQGFARLVIDTNSTPVPEPSALGGIVFLGVGGWWLKRKQKASLTV
ncbi:PEP-CTERM sorting domain-containing protein [Nostoc sp. TCL240-02]|uniref:PEP-CTERM sorting domain-containing protein n=1 Tax=Nostoc sp. TCL240-02 TaxID=2572090 RepID=UPI00157F84D3|nr:PEP-CTERM sorting domain-containing protein [Nostoc sp. TCL240-02]QKQ73883.1 PEP-CTERM sorting domain-containing protein [Nostoc sp. TCL240-02]